MPGDTKQTVARVGIAHDGLLAAVAQHGDRDGGVGAAARTRDRRVGPPVPRPQRPGGVAGLAAAQDADQTGQSERLLQGRRGEMLGRAAGPVSTGQEDRVGVMVEVAV
jgi:hypothetical protein